MQGEEDYSSLRSMIVAMIDKIKSCLSEITLRSTKDPVKRLEMILWRKISGFGLGGMASSSAYMLFKKKHYDTLVREEERKMVRNALLGMLKSRNYNMFQKEIIAYVCSDIGIYGSEEEVANVREASARGMTIQQLIDFKEKQRVDREKHGLY